MHVAEQLHLDMAGPLDELLDKDGARAEGRLAFPLGGFEGCRQLVLAMHHPHAAATAAVGRLEDHRPAELLRDLKRLASTGDRLGAAGENRYASPPGQITGRRLVAEHLEELDPRAHEDDARLGTGGGKLGVFGEEAVAGMDGVDPVFLGDRHDAVDIEIGANRLAGLPDQVGLVGLEAMEGEAVFVGIDRHGTDAQLMGRAKHPDRNLTAVGDEEFSDRSHAAGPLAGGPEENQRRKS